MGTISFKMIFRNWRRNKTFALISILSLAIGIACINLLAAFVIHEYNVEAGNPNRDRIHMLWYPSSWDRSLKLTASPDQLAQIGLQVPEIEHYTQVDKSPVSYCQVGEHAFKDFQMLETDNAFVRIFPQEVVIGDVDEVLRSPDQIAITESFARRLFGKTDPINQPIKVFFQNVRGPEYKTGLLTYTVGAVLKDRPQAALPFDLLIMSDRKHLSPITLVTTAKGAYPSVVKQKMNDLRLKDHRDAISFQLTGIISACFETDRVSTRYLSVRQTGLLQIALLSALFMLITACINYVNLNFSRIVQQLHSIQVQRLMGAGNDGITRQLFADTFTTVLIAFLLSLLIQRDLLPVFNNILSVNMQGSFLYSNQVMPATLGVTLLLAVIPAAYISRMLSRLSLSEYKQFYTGKGKQRIIMTLAVVQFVIAIGLVTATLSVRQQITMLKDKIADYTYVYSLGNGDATTPMQPFKERIHNLPGIEAMSVGNSSATSPMMLLLTGDGIPRRITLIQGDEGLIETMNLRQIAGSPWEEAIKEYPSVAFVQETYAKYVFPSDKPYPIGHFLREYDIRMSVFYDSPVIQVDSTLRLGGVVEDFFNTPLSSPMQDGILLYQRDGNSLLQVRLRPEDATVTLNQIRNEWDTLYPGRHLEVASVHAKILESNRATTRMSDLLMMYSVISIFLTCFGLFGMTLYVTEQRTKEIGIRKVNGSTTLQIMWMFIRQFLVWIGIAFLITTPLTWYLMSRWLETFAYRVDMTFGICLLGGFIVIGVTLLTVSWHSYRAAAGNPVKALRSE